MLYICIFMYFFFNIIMGKRIKKINYYFFQVFFIIFLGFTYKMGSDWIFYQKLYNEINIDNIKEFAKNGTEAGYLWYSLTMKKIFNFNYEIFMGITLGTCIYILLRELKKRAENFYLSVFIYLVIYLYNASIEPVVRQLIATTIIINSLKYIEKKLIVKFIIAVVLAAQFHKTAYIFVVLYFLDKIDLNMKMIVISLFTGIVGLSSAKMLLSKISLIFPTLSKYNYYFINQNYSEQMVSIEGILLKIILSLIFIYIILNSGNLERKYIKNSAIIYCILMILQYKLAILYRIQNYLAFFLALALASVGSIKIWNKKIRYQNNILSILLLFYFGISFYRTVANNKINIFKYTQYSNYFVENLKGELHKSLSDKIFFYEIKLNKLKED